MKLTKGALSICVTLIFLIALVLFLIVYVQDKQKTKPNDRPNVDNIWIHIFMTILIVGVLVSISIVYKYSNSANTHYYKPTKTECKNTFRKMKKLITICK